MRYYVFETAVADGSQAFATTPKDDYNEALMLFHQIRASVLANKNVTYSLTMIIGESGHVIQTEGSGSLEPPEDKSAD